MFTCGLNQPLDNSSPRNMYIKFGNQPFVKPPLGTFETG